MFFLGSTQLTLTKETGEFFCPNCGERRAFRLRVVRQFLTVYFIPLIPLQAIKEFAECTTCSQTFDPTTLSNDKASFEAKRQQQAFEIVRNAIITIVAADDAVTDEELEVVRDFARRYQQSDITAEKILEEASSFHQFEVDAVAWIRRVADKLSDDEKELLVYQAFLATTANGELSQTRQGILAKLPEALGMPESMFRQIIQRAAES